MCIVVHATTCQLYEMLITKYPNKEALHRALDIYIDAMRPVVVRNLRRVNGTTVKAAVLDVLQELGREREFKKNLQANKNNVGGAIDHGHIPWIIAKYWREAFVTQFNGDRSIRLVTHVIRDSRNKASHRGAGDLSENDVVAGLSNIIQVLQHTDDLDAMAAVAEIRINLLNPSKPQAVAVAPNSRSNRADEVKAKVHRVRDSKRVFKTTTSPATMSVVSGSGIDEAEVKERGVLIRISETYREGMSSLALYEATRGAWVIGDRRDKVEYAFAVSKGTVKEVYKVHRWHRAGTMHYHTRPCRHCGESDGYSKGGRWEFSGEVAADDIRRRYIGRSVKRYFPKGNVSPFRYTCLHGYEIIDRLHQCY